MLSKYLILGMAGHGKDELGALLSKLLGIRSTSSSIFVAEKIMLPAFEKIGITYQSPIDCYNDRNGCRDFWHDKIHEYNAEDKARLGRELFSEYDIYMGLRNREEFKAIKEEKLFDLSIWIDATERLGVTETTSISLTKEDADIVIYNNGSKEELFDKVLRLTNTINR